MWNGVVDVGKKFLAVLGAIIVIVSFVIFVANVWNWAKRELKKQNVGQTLLVATRQHSDTTWDQWRAAKEYAKISCDKEAVECMNRALESPRLPASYRMEGQQFLSHLNQWR